MISPIAFPYWKAKTLSGYSAKTLCRSSVLGLLSFGGRKNQNFLGRCVRLSRCFQRFFWRSRNEASSRVAQLELFTPYRKPPTEGLAAIGT
jgi:hypothetical protein